jgi:hypothetical protein
MDFLIANSRDSHPGISLAKNNKARTKTKLGPGLFNVFRRRPTLPLGRPSSTIGAEELNFRVRDGNGCFLYAIAAEN